MERERKRKLVYSKTSSLKTEQKTPHLLVLSWNQNIPESSSVHRVILNRELSDLWTFSTFNMHRVFVEIEWNDWKTWMKDERSLQMDAFIAPMCADEMDDVRNIPFASHYSTFSDNSNGLLLQSTSSTTSNKLSYCQWSQIHFSFRYQEGYLQNFPNVIQFSPVNGRSFGMGLIEIAKLLGVEKVSNQYSTVITHPFQILIVGSTREDEDIPNTGEVLQDFFGAADRVRGWKGNEWKSPSQPVTVQAYIEVDESSPDSYTTKIREQPSKCNFPWKYSERKFFSLQWLP